MNLCYSGVTTEDGNVLSLLCNPAENFVLLCKTFKINPRFEVAWIHLTASIFHLCWAKNACLFCVHIRTVDVPFFLAVRSWYECTWLMRCLSGVSNFEGKISSQRGLLFLLDQHDLLWCSLICRTLETSVKFLRKSSLWIEHASNCQKSLCSLPGLVWSCFCKQFIIKTGDLHKWVDYINK